MKKVKDHAYFCEIVFENITQELIYNGCVNCDFTDIDIDEQGYWTEYLDSAYQGCIYRSHRIGRL